MTFRVPAIQPHFFEEDIEIISEKFKGILRGESFLTMHKYGQEFEEKFARFIGTKYAVGCNSGTSALEMIFRALDVKGKDVILPSNTFIATANAILNAGGVPVFADCQDNMCLDAEDVRSRITERTAAVCVVHIAGVVSRDVLELQKLCKEKNVYLVEDAAQAHGSTLGGVKAGSFGVAAGFSFFSTKVMTTGEGGMVTTNDAVLVERMKSLREFGKVKKGVYINNHVRMGYNWRLPEVASLMGLRQLKALPKFIERRQQIAKIYDEELSGVVALSIVRPDEPKGHNYFKYPVLVHVRDREKFHLAMEAEGVQLSGYVYEIPLHKQPVFPEYHDVWLPMTETVCAEHVCLPIFYSMTDEQVMIVVEAVKKVLGELL